MSYSRAVQCWLDSSNEYSAGGGKLEKTKKTIHLPHSLSHHSYFESDRSVSQK